MKKPAASSHAQARTIRPLIPGAWRVLSLPDACALITRFITYEAGCGASPLTAESASFRSARILPLACLPGWLLAELEATFCDGAVGHLAFLLGPEGRLFPVDWSSRPVVGATRASLAMPLADAQARELFHLFCNALGNDGRRFCIAGSVDDVDLPPGRAPRGFKAFRSALRPLAIERRDNQIFASATMIFSGQLFLAQLRLLPAGGIDMVSDEPIGPACVSDEELQGLFRIVHPRRCAQP